MNRIESAADDLPVPPDDVDPASVAAVGELTDAFETVEIARGHLFAFHQLTGSADFKLESAIDRLRDAGHTDFAATLRRELLGRNVLPGRWTFQVVEDYDETYYEPFRSFERAGRDLVGGLAHLHEAELKRRRRSAGEHGHEATPDEPAARRLAHDDPPTTQFRDPDGDGA